MRKLLFAAAMALLGPFLLPAHASDTPVTAGGYNDFGCAAATGAFSSCTGITRPANTTAYSAGQLVCGATCAPIPIIAGRNMTQSSGSGLIDKVLLLKTTASTTNAAFNIFFYSNSPTNPSLSDQSSYTGPYKADITTGIYVGEATCASTAAVATTDTGAFYVCTLDVNAMSYKTTGKTLYAMIEANGSYTPGSAEQFYVVTYELQD